MQRPLAEGEPLNVIGHSFGASEGEMDVGITGVKVTNLITIDPVGSADGYGVTKFSNVRLG